MYMCRGINERSEEHYDLERAALNPRTGIQRNQRTLRGALRPSDQKIKSRACFKLGSLFSFPITPQGTLQIPSPHNAAT